jgi:choline transport protein
LLTCAQLLVCLVVSIILSAINFGSSTAFTAVTSVSNAALLFTYLISIGCVAWKRLRGEPLMPRRWSLGRFGGLINAISLVFLVVALIFSFFPTAPYFPGQDFSDGGKTWWAEDYNFAIFIFTLIFVLAGVYYVCGGRKKYLPPVSLVRRDD